MTFFIRTLILIDDAAQSFINFQSEIPTFDISKRNKIMFKVPKQTGLNRSELTSAIGVTT